MRGLFGLVLLGIVALLATANDFDGDNTDVAVGDTQSADDLAEIKRIFEDMVTSLHQNKQPNWDKNVRFGKKWEKQGRFGKKWHAQYRFDKRWNKQGRFGKRWNKQGRFGKRASANYEMYD